MVDAKAVLGAASKGRSSSPSLLRVMRAIGAHCLAGDLLLRLLYVPSEHNPSDGASRGKRRRPTHNKFDKDAQTFNMYDEWCMAKSLECNNENNNINARKTSESHCTK